MSQRPLEKTEETPQENSIVTGRRKEGKKEETKRKEDERECRVESAPDDEANGQRGGALIAKRLAI